jgi:1,4-dihydroxy-2-naphthoate octaprenyltransferase
VWLVAARLRTLPLSVAGIMTGNALALSLHNFSIPVFVLSLLTAIAFQITSNFANDYGDGIKGTDSQYRIGPNRVLQKNWLTPLQLKYGIYAAGGVSLLLSVVLIYIALGAKQLLISVAFLLLAIAAIWAALRYTMGQNAYGYHGWGDVFVFIFFGWVSVVGSHFLQSKTMDFDSFALGTAIGMLSVGVLNLNNMRDIENDKRARKNTLVVKMGLRRAKQYHFFLILGGLLFFFLGMEFPRVLDQPLLLLMALPLLYHLYKVYGVEAPKDFDPLLKPLALTTFAMALALFAIFF